MALHVYDPRTDETMMVVDVGNNTHDATLVYMASLTTGKITPTDKTIQLADRGDGALYASRSLNGWEGGYGVATPTDGGNPVQSRMFVSLCTNFD